ncbi:carbohydrate kinase family protein, partial [Pseudostreptobacillus sp.]
SHEDLIKAAKVLLEKGVTNVFITLGSKGIFYMNNEKYEIIANPNISAVDITGAGDSFAAGVAFSLYNNFEIEKMARCALSMSILNVTHLGTCFKGLNKNILNDTMKTYFNIEL